jgi:hypothetical protein
MRIIALFVLFAFAASAQTYTYRLRTYQNGIQADMKGDPGDVFMATFTFSNTTSAPIQLFMDRFQKNNPPYWAVCYCYILCHSPANDTVTVDIMPNSTTDVSIQFKTDSVNPGIATNSFKIYQKGFQNAEHVVDLTATTMNDVGIDDNTGAPALSLFPNPVSNVLHITAEKNIGVYEVTDVNGRKVLEEFTRDNSADVDLSELPAGVYFIQTYTNGLRHAWKILKQ